MRIGRATLHAQELVLVELVEQVSQKHRRAAPLCNGALDRFDALRAVDAVRANDPRKACEPRLLLHHPRISVSSGFLLLRRDLVRDRRDRVRLDVRHDCRPSAIERHLRAFVRILPELPPHSCDRAPFGRLAGREGRMDVLVQVSHQHKSVVTKAGDHDITYHNHENTVRPLGSRQNPEPRCHLVVYFGSPPHRHRQR